MRDMYERCPPWPPEHHGFRIQRGKRRLVMVQFGKKAAVLTAAGVLAAMSVTGCSGSIDTDAVVATVGDEDITL